MGGGQGRLNYMRTTKVGKMGGGPKTPRKNALFQI